MFYYFIFFNIIVQDVTFIMFPDDNCFAMEVCLSVRLSNIVSAPYAQNPRRLEGNFRQMFTSSRHCDSVQILLVDGQCHARWSTYLSLRFCFLFGSFICLHSGRTHLWNVAVQCYARRY